MALSKICKSARAKQEQEAAWVAAQLEELRNVSAVLELEEKTIEFVGKRLDPERQDQNFQQNYLQELAGSCGSSSRLRDKMATLEAKHCAHLRMTAAISNNISAWEIGADSVEPKELAACWQRQERGLDASHQRFSPCQDHRMKFDEGSPECISTEVKKPQQDSESSRQATELDRERDFWISFTKTKEAALRAATSELRTECELRHTQSKVLLQRLIGDPSEESCDAEAPTGDHRRNESRAETSKNWSGSLRSFPRLGQLSTTSFPAMSPHMRSRQNGDEREAIRSGSLMHQGQKVKPEVRWREPRIS